MGHVFPVLITKQKKKRRRETMNDHKWSDGRKKKPLKKNLFDKNPRFFLSM